MDWLDRELDVGKFDDVSNNGLQVEASGEVGRVAFAVDASLESVRNAAKSGAQLLVVHHGISWGGGIRRIVGGVGRVVRAAIDGGVSVAAYHLPLDANAKYGNNHELARFLGLRDISPAFSYHGNVIGVTGYNPQGVKKLDIPKVRKKRAVADSVYKSQTLTKEHVQRYTGYPKNTLEFPSEVFGKNTRLHPTQKPLKLCEYLIKTYTDPGDAVFDSCSGSGTTAEACIRTGRNYIAIEKSETYYSRAGVRLEKAEAETRETFSRIRENTRRLMKYAEDIADLAAETLPPSVVPQSHA